MPDTPLKPVTDSTIATPAATALPQSLEQCHELIHVLVQNLAALQDQVAALQERATLNSKNSSKPPSSDGPSVRKGRVYKSSGRKRGAQKGHTGTYRELLDPEQVDGLIDCRPPAQCACGGALQIAGQPYRHQVVDMAPSAKSLVHEYRLYTGVCQHCRKSQRAPLPAGVPSGQIGPRALALVGELGTRYQLTQQKTRDLLAELTGVDFSVGAVSQAQGKVAQALGAPVAAAKATLVQATVLHMDESSYPREGQLNWVWAAVQPKLVLYSILPSRARYVLHDLIGTNPKALVVSDRYSAYAHLPPRQRQVCWAHLIRDFTRIAQRDGIAGRIGRRLLAYAYLLFRWRERGKVGKQWWPLRKRLLKALRQGATQGACRQTANTCANLLKLWPALWNFARRQGVEPTNNSAEQALRSLVLKRKISGPTRSLRGDQFLARGFSVYETCLRQGRNLFDYLHCAVMAWIDNSTPPSLVPQPI